MACLKLSGNVPVDNDKLTISVRRDRTYILYSFRSGCVTPTPPSPPPFATLYTCSLERSLHWIFFAWNSRFLVAEWAIESGGWYHIDIARWGYNGHVTVRDTWAMMDTRATKR